jgi:hypothetical protein
MHARRNSRGFFRQTSRVSAVVIHKRAVENSTVKSECVAVIGLMPRCQHHGSVWASSNVPAVSKDDFGIVLRCHGLSRQRTPFHITMD